MSTVSHPATEENLHRVLNICGATDIGAQRRQNQDTFVIADLASGATSRPCIRTEVFVSKPGVLLLVCDGMGGPPAGDVAARVAAVSIKDGLAEAGIEVVDAPGRSLESALAGANRAILNEVHDHPHEKGMGTTCTAVVVSPERLSVAQVGDSRAYLLRDGRLALLTRDQTMAAQLVDAGALKPEQVETFPYRHVLVQALGSERSVRPVITDVDVREGDRVLLCSDGLHGPVGDDAIAAILKVPGDAAHAAQALIAAALAAGGPDNVTVVVADCGPLETSALS
jgi:serine/threonine protein phosphatase PrpC